MEKTNEIVDEYFVEQLFYEISELIYGKLPRLLDDKKRILSKDAGLSITDEEDFILEDRKRFYRVSKDNTVFEATLSLIDDYLTLNKYTFPTPTISEVIKIAINIFKETNFLPNIYINSVNENILLILKCGITYSGGGLQLNKNQLKMIIYNKENGKSETIKYWDDGKESIYDVLQLFDIIANGIKISMKSDIL